MNTQIEDHASAPHVRGRYLENALLNFYWAESVKAGLAPNRLAMAQSGGSIKFRSDASPETLLKNLVLSPLIYIRLVGLVSVW